MPQPDLAFFKKMLESELETQLNKMMLEQKIPEEVVNQRIAALARTFGKKGKQPTLTPAIIGVVSRYDQDNQDHQSAVDHWLELNPIDAIDDKGLTLMHHAVASGKLDLLKYFILDKACAFEMEDETGLTPLLYAVQSLKNSVHRKPVLDCVRFLLSQNAKPVSSHPIFKKTAAAIAAVQGDLEVIKMLDEHHVNLDGEEVNSPLWWARSAQDQQAAQAVIEYLENRAHSLGANSF
jgi:hypothetical protein